MTTVVAFGDPKAVKKYSATLFLDIKGKSYWDRKFVGTSSNSVIQRLTDLESDAGDTITYDLSVRLRNKPTSGDARLEGKEEGLRFYTDDVKINQLRHGVSAGGKMTRKRTVHNMRTIAKDALSSYWSSYSDEMHFIYLSGARGINEDFIEDIAYAGHAGNAIVAPDSTHLMYAGAGTAKNNVTTAMKLDQVTVERAATKVSMMRSANPNAANMQPVDIGGEPHFVLLISPYQTHDMRTADTSGWLANQRAAAAAEGKNNPIFNGAIGMIKNVVIHEHRNVIRFSDYGVGTNVLAARALFLGQQAGVVAYGSSGGLRFAWNEEIHDHGNEPVVASGTIMGVKKSRFNDLDFGVLAIDTAAAVV